LSHGLDPLCAHHRFGVGECDFFVKLAAGRLSSSLGVLLYGSCTFLTGVVWVAWQWAHGVPQHAQTSGVFAALGVGVAFSGVTLGLYATFGSGAPISVGAPVIRLGGLVLASLAGLILLQEPLTLRYVIGMILVCSGVYLIVTR
jgi:drug/metabolite transporter (DMT)-like permease